MKQLKDAKTIKKVVFLHNNEEVADALHSKTRDFNRAIHTQPHDRFHGHAYQPLEKLKKGRMNGFAMVWRTARMGRLIAVTAFSMAIMLLAFGLPVTAYGSQNIGQNKQGGYVRYTLDLINTPS
ncbi:MAG: hypothetical protein NO110_06625 [Sulfolobales archaeon]|jgi:hypothetical protein|nr:hypothetical protein [Sulfolobales archaeon]